MATIAKSFATSALVRPGDRGALRTDNYRYVCHDDGAESLFDLTDEFGEYTDLSPDPIYATDLALMRRLLLHRVIAAQQPLPRTWRY